MQSWLFSIITPVFSVTILQQSFEYADLLLKKHLLLLSMLKAFVLLNVFNMFFCGTCDAFFQGFWLNKHLNSSVYEWEYEKWKQTIYLSFSPL